LVKAEYRVADLSEQVRAERVGQLPQRRNRVLCAEPRQWFVSIDRVERSIHAHAIGVGDDSTMHEVRRT
jgi:hypothetical protein